MKRWTSVCQSRKMSTSKAIPIHVPEKPVDTTKLHLINQSLHTKYGPIYAEKLGPDVDAVWIADAKLAEILLRNEPANPIHVVPQCWQVFNQKYNVGRGLFFVDGQEWNAMRREMNPIFLKNQGLQVAKTHAYKVTDKLMQNLQSFKGQDIDLEPFLHRWSVESTLASLFGDYYVDMSNDGLDEFIKHVHAMFAASANLQTQSALQAYETNNLDWQKFTKSAFAALQYLEQRFDMNAKSNGLASLLCQSFDAKTVSNICNDLIIAAADTTSYTALWTLYLLGTHSQDFQNVKGACREAMRLYPVAPFLTRVQQEAFALNGFELSPGQLILFSTYAMGRNDAYFTDAHVFNPKRWERNEFGKLQGVLSSFASLPFGFGVRSCIGRRLAEQQLEHLIQKFGQHFDFKVVNEKPVEMSMKLIGMPSSRILFRLQ